MQSKTVRASRRMGNDWSARRGGIPVMIMLAVMPLCAAPAAWGVTYTAADTFDINPATLLGSNSNSFAVANFGSEQAGYGYGGNTGGFQHALLWTGTAGSILDLNPAFLGGSSSSAIDFVSGSQQAGYGSSPAVANLNHALIWNGTAASAVDLNPATLLGNNSNSIALATTGSQQVGYGNGANTVNLNHALLWSGTAASAIDLNPGTLLGSNSSSFAVATNGSQQSGYGHGGNTGGYDHALIWNGTAASAVDLNPTSLLGSASASYVQSAYGNQQAGYGSGGNTGNAAHALLWTGTAASAVDLHPASLLGTNSSSAVEATNGSQQVGYGYGPNTGNNFHALLWSGTAASVVDLSTVVPASYYGYSSVARSIDPYGNITGYVINPTGTHAVEWLAGDMYNVGGSGFWSTAANWTSEAPGAGNDVLLLQQDSSNRTVTYNTIGNTPLLGNVTIDATGTGMMTLAQTIGTLNTTNETVGFIGSGTFNQTGGTHVISGSLTLASKAGSTGIYTLNSAGAVLNVGVIYLNSGGTFNQTAGTLICGSFVDNGGTVNGTLTNQGTFTYSSGAFNGRLVNSGSVYLSAPFTAGNGIENDSAMTISQANPITVNGAGLDNLGTFTLAGGLLSGSGAVTNDVGGVMYAQGAIGPAFTNYGQLYPTGLLVLSSASSNFGAAYLSTGQGLRVNSAFTNTGQIDFSGGSISGTGAITNIGGIIVQSYGGISNSLTNTGYIQLLYANALLTGSAITNSGTIRGTGQISNAISNNGIIRPENGEMDLSGSVTNSAGAQIQIGIGNTLFVTAGLATNAGTIALSGGTFDNNNIALNNTGTINGSGTIRTGALTNSSGAILLLTDANSSVYGPVTNSIGGNLKIVSNTTTFYGNVTNNGTIKVTSGVARFLGNGVSMTVGGTYNSDPSDNYFNGLAITSGGLVTGGAGDRFFLTGGSGFTNAGTFTNGGMLTASAVTNTGTFTQNGPQFWSTASIFTNAAGSANFGSDSGANGANLSITAAGGLITFNADQHLLSLNIVSAKVDVTGHELFITSTPAATIRSYLLAAYDKGAWDQPGLGSSLAQAAPHDTALGYAAVAGQVLVKYTWYGDTNLDGLVNSADLSAISPTGSTWSTGDFNYDGVVNADDYGLYMLGLSKSGGANISTTLPEPGAGMLLVAGGLLSSRRMRKRF